MDDASIRVIGAGLAVYGVVILLQRRRFAEGAARSNAKWGRLLFIYPRRLRTFDFQLKVWRVMIVPLGLFFVVTGLVIAANPRPGS